MPIINRDNIKVKLSKITNAAKDTAETVVKATKDGASTVAKKSGDIVEISKLTVTINSEEAKTKDLYFQIGQSIYEKFQNDIYIDPELVETCRKIFEIKKDIYSMQNRIKELKNMKICPNCDEEMDVDTKFCGKCGTEQELSEVEKVVTEEHIMNCDCGCHKDQPLNCKCSKEQTNVCECNCQCEEIKTEK